MSRNTNESKRAEGEVALSEAYAQLMDMAAASPASVSLSKVKAVIAEHSEVLSRRDEDGNTPLIVAAKNKNDMFFDSVLFAVDSIGVEGEFLKSAKIPNNAGETLVQCAAENGLSCLVCNLIDLGFDISGLEQVINNVDNEGATALMYAAGMYRDEQPNIAILQALLNNGANPDAGMATDNGECGITAMMIAAAHGFTQSVEALLKAGANPHIRSSRGYTASSLASEAGHASVVDMLKAPSLIDGTNYSPRLMVAKPDTAAGDMVSPDDHASHSISVRLK